MRLRSQAHSGLFGFVVHYQVSQMGKSILKATRPFDELVVIYRFNIIRSYIMPLSQKSMCFCCMI